jgi:hypothetical protein
MRCAAAVVAKTRVALHSVCLHDEHITASEMTSEK